MASSALSTIRKPQEKYDPEQVAAAVRSAKGLITIAARTLDCDPGTIRNYAKRYASVRDAITEAREGILDMTEARLFQAIDKGEPWAIALTLRTLGRDRGYIERVEQEVKGTVGHYVIDIGGSDDSSTSDS